MLEETQLFVLDMDGTFFMGQSVIEGALDFIEEVKRRKKKFLFFTNNSSFFPDIGKLHGNVFGIRLSY